MDEKIEQKLVFRVESFRKLPNPYQQHSDENDLGDTTPQMYMAMCDVKSVPDNIPMDTNPRKQKLTTTVAKKIKESLLDVTSADFYLLNRGMLISAKSVAFNNYNNELTIVLEDTELHGNVDGGHTYKVILENRDELDYNQQYVKLEILTGIENIFENLAAARNTSTSVKDQSIAELENKFELIKKGIKNEPFYKRVYFEENADGDIDVKDILAILSMFNLDKYKDENDLPVSAYNGKKTHVDYYLEKYNEYMEGPNNPYTKMQPIMIDVFKLYDRIETGIESFYRQNNPKGRYGAIKGVMPAKKGKCYISKYGEKTMENSTPTAFIVPILGAFRALLEERDGVYQWKSDPFIMIKRIGKDLVETTIERSRTLGNNPNAVGKDKGNWKTLYQTVLIESLKQQK